MWLVDLSQTTNEEMIERLLELNHERCGPPRGMARPYAETYANGQGRSGTAADDGRPDPSLLGIFRTGADGGGRRLQRLLISGLRVPIPHGSTQKSVVVPAMAPLASKAVGLNG